MKCIVVTPEKTEVDLEATFVAVPLFDGEYGIGHGHTPVVGRLGVGELRITRPDGEIVRLCVEGGFMEVNSNVVSILTNRATRPDGMSVTSAEELFEAAKSKIARTEDLFDRKEKEVLAARNRLRLARKWAGK